MSKCVLPNFKVLVAEYKQDAETRASQCAKDLLPTVAGIMNLPVALNGDPNDLHATGTQVAVATPAYSKWLASVQERNPLIGRKRLDKDGNVIGSMFEGAPEFEEDSEETKTPEEMAQEVVDTIGKWRKDADGVNRYHINKDFEPYMPTEFEEKLDGDAAKLSDLYTIQNSVAKRLGYDFEEIMEGVVADLKDFHMDDEDFALPDNLDDMVKTAIEHEETRLRLAYEKKQEQQQKPSQPAAQQIAMLPLSGSVGGVRDAE